MRIEVVIYTDRLATDDVAEALSDLAEKFRRRKDMPTDEVGQVEVNGEQVGFWETVA